jgi:hypothetical protein
MINTTDICRMAISIGILMTLSSSVAQTTREKVSIETVYADRVENVYSDRVGEVYTDRFGKVHTDRIALPPSQPSREAYYCDSIGCIRCDGRGDCIRPCGVATCAVVVFPREPRTAQPAQGR